MSKRFNEEFITLMDNLNKIMTKNGEPFRAKAYQKAQETILTYPGDILTPDDLSDLEILNLWKQSEAQLKSWRKSLS